MALRRRRTASSISSRYGSHALALGDLPGGGGGAGPLGEPGAAARRGGCSVAESVDTSPPLAGFDPAESVDTSLAGFGAWPHPRRAIRMPALFQIRAGGPPPHPDAGLNASQRPSQPPQRNDLLSLLFAQDVRHPGGEACLVRLRQRPGASISFGRFSGVHVWPVLGVH